MKLLVHYRDNKKKEEQGRSHSRVHLFLWSTVAVVAASILGFYPGPYQIMRMARHFFLGPLNHPYFSVQEIQVRGGDKLKGSEIVAMAGLSHGMNIWTIDPKIIEKTVRKHPWVKRVLVRREFPRRVVIDVKERTARGILALGKLYYVDQEGFLFKEVGRGEKVDFPILTGLRQADVASHSQSTREKIRQALKLSELMRRKRLALSELHFLPRGGLVLYPMAYPVALRMGWGDWRAKIKRLERVLAIWKGRESHIAVLDLRFRNQVVTRLKGG
ncbi:MAG: cell division protein FtsQ/DivIB [Candidatus Binatia bacterium]